MKLTLRSVILSAAFALVMACGSDDSDESSENSDESTVIKGTRRLTDEELCSLKVNETTQAQAVSSLGEPTFVDSSKDSTLATWHYISAENGQIKKNESLRLTFDSMTVLKEMSLLGRQFPACSRPDSGV